MKSNSLGLHQLRNYEALVSTPHPAASRGWKRVIVVSNRAPIKVVSDSQKCTITKSSGGLVTAMTPILHRGIAGYWIGWSGTGERNSEEALEEALRTSDPGEFEVGLVALSPEDVAEYYNGFCNRVLVPALVGDVDGIDRGGAMRWWPRYCAVQNTFADKVCESLRYDDIIWVHDFHLMGVAHALRKRGVRNPIGFFLHTPFPEQKVFGAIPQHRLLLRQMLHFDIIGVQTKAFEQNFVRAIRSLDVQLSIGSDNVLKAMYQGSTTRIGSFPVSIDICEFERQLHASDTRRNIARLHARLRKNEDTKFVLSVGRRDPSKGFFEELLAFDRLFQKHPQLVGSVVLTQLMVPSRDDVPAYQRYTAKVRALARELSARYGDGIIRQEHMHMGRARYLAYLNVADVLDIPTLSDGINLVAKEGSIVGNPMMVMLLGRHAGAAAELGGHALLIDPKDIDAYADTLYQALTMPEAERHARKSMLKSIVTAHDVYRWWSHQQEPLFRQVCEERQAYA